MTCMISGGDLPMNVMWMFNRSPIGASPDIVTEKRGKRIHVLMIEAVRAKHAGNYTCSVENSAGIVEHSSQLIVDGLNRCYHYCLLFFVFIPFFRSHNL